MVRTASDSCFGDVCWGRAAPWVAWCPLGVGRCWSLRCGKPSCVCALVPVVASSFSAPRSLFLPLPGPWVVFCSCVVSSRCPVPVGACLSPWALPCPLAGVSDPVPCPPLARALSIPGVVVVRFGGGLWGAHGPRLEPGGLDPPAEGFGGVGGAEALDRVPEEGFP